MKQYTRASHAVSYYLPRRPRLFIIKQVLILLGCLFALFIIANIIVPPMSGASSFAGRILLGFNERYGPTNTNHLGVDVAWEAGSVLYAPVSGTISYVGKVPAAAGVGKNVTAVTITTTEGHQVTLNPFASTPLGKGDSVTKGQVMGTLSDTGDPSSAQSHVHLSLRVDGKYRDPSHLIDSVLGSPTTGTTSATGQPPLAGGGTPIPQPPLITSNAPAPQFLPEPSRQFLSQGPSLQSAQLGAEGMGAQQHHHIAAIPAPIPLITETPAKQPESLISAATPMTTPTGPAAIIEIPGLHIPAMESASYSEAPKIAKPRAPWLSSLSTSQLAGVLYAIGLIVPCTYVGIVTIVKKIGIFPPPVTHLFTAREEK